MPSTTDNESLAAQRAEDALRHRRVLNGMIDVGAELVGLLHRQALAQVEAEPAVAVPVVEVAVAYERIARAVRRSVLLVQRLGEAPAANVRAAARRRIIRVVEDKIHREADGDVADGLRAELAERLDGPELEEELGDRPVDEIIEEIVRDLGLERRTPGSRAFVRRRPADVTDLCALAGRVGVFGRACRDPPRFKPDAGCAPGPHPGPLP